jgi:uncharacterized membrane protein
MGLAIILFKVIRKLGAYVSNFRFSIILWVMQHNLLTHNLRITEQLLGQSKLFPTQTFIDLNYLNTKHLVYTF